MKKNNHAICIATQHRKGADFGVSRKRAGLKMIAVVSWGGKPGRR